MFHAEPCHKQSEQRYYACYMALTALNIDKYRVCYSSSQSISSRLSLPATFEDIRLPLPESQSSIFSSVRLFYSVYEGVRIYLILLRMCLYKKPCPALQHTHPSKSSLHAARTVSMPSYATKRLITSAQLLSLHHKLSDAA